jgi:iron-sulfur cluster assembly protein
MEDKEYKIVCTPIAAKKAKKYIVERNNPNTKGIRFGLRSGGCDGLSPVIEFADKVNEKDHIFVFDGVSFYIDQKSMVYLNGTTIDYKVSLMGSGFRFDIPQKVGNCSCGASIKF